MHIKSLFSNCCLALCLVFLGASCGDKEEEFNDGLTRYTVIGNVPSIAASLISKVTVYEYNIADVRIDSNLIEDPGSGTNYVFVANDETSHLKIRLDSEAGTHRWGDTIVRVIPGGNVKITIGINSPVCFNEPMLQ